GIERRQPPQEAVITLRFREAEMEPFGRALLGEIPLDVGLRFGTADHPGLEAFGRLLGAPPTDDELRTAIRAAGISQQQNARPGCGITPDLIFDLSLRAGIHRRSRIDSG